jgi:predicted HNH restriction endonuclease
VSKKHALLQQELRTLQKMNSSCAPPKHEKRARVTEYKLSDEDKKALQEEELQSDYIPSSSDTSTENEDDTSEDEGEDGEIQSTRRHRPRSS